MRGIVGVSADACFSLLNMQWRLIDNKALRFRTWNHEFVIYNAFSGDTHILDESAAQILLALQRCPHDMLSLAQFLADDWECELNDDFLQKIEAMLSEMHALSLVEPA